MTSQNGRLAHLLQQHENVLHAISQANYSVPISITCEGQNLKCKVLGHDVTMTPRAVALNGHVHALEYDFVIEWQEERISLFTAYLQQELPLTTDAKGDQSLIEHRYQYNDHEVKAYCNAFANGIMAGLLASKVFAPRLVTEAEKATT